MSDELVVNGAGADINVPIASNEHDSDEPTNQTLQKLTQKIQILEDEKKQLVNDADSSAAKIKQLEDEISTHESDKRALSSIAGRAAELETEVSRMQHDLISSMSEANAELSELKRVVEELKTSESENLKKIDIIEKERDLLLERLDDVTKKLKESEDRVREFENKIDGFEKEKDEKIKNMKRSVDELESVLVKNESEMEISKKEKDELRMRLNDLEALLKESETKINELDQFQKEKAVENTVDGHEKMSKSKVDWPVIAATAGAVAMVAVVYFRHAKF